MLLMHANNREDIKEAYAGDIVALAGLKDTTTGDTLCDPDQSGHPRADGIPRSGHRGRGRAEDQGRPGKDGRRARPPGRGGSVLPRLDRPGDGPDHHQGDGRAPPRDHGRPPEARPTRSTPMSARRRWPIARPSPKSRDRLHPQEADRRLGPVRPDQARVRAAASGARASCSRARSSAARCRRNSSRRREGPRGLARDRRARRLPDDRLQGRR